MRKKIALQQGPSKGLMIGLSMDKQGIAEGEAGMIFWESHQQGLLMAAPRV